MNRVGIKIYIYSIMKKKKKNSQKLNKKIRYGSQWKIEKIVCFQTWYPGSIAVQAKNIWVHMIFFLNNQR